MPSLYVMTARDRGAASQLEKIDMLVSREFRRRINKFDRKGRRRTHCGTVRSIYALTASSSTAFAGDMPVRTIASRFTARR